MSRDPELEALYVQTMARLKLRLGPEVSGLIEDLISYSIERVDRAVNRSFVSRRWLKAPASGVTESAGGSSEPGGER